MTDEKNMGWLTPEKMIPEILIPEKLVPEKLALDEFVVKNACFWWKK